MRCIRVRRRFRRQKISFFAVVIMCNEPVSLIKIKDIKFARERFYAVYFSVLTASGKSSNKIRALDAAPDKDFAPGTFHVRTSFEESLLFNPSCSVVNLLESIKERCGYGDTDRVLDLTDETGLVLELSSHKYENATKYLSSKGFYVLVEKLTTELPSNDPNETGLSQEVKYVPLLNKPSDKFKGYKARVSETRLSPERSSSRSTGRVGKRTGKTKLNRRADNTLAV